MSDNVIHAVAGAGGGILSMLLTYPLITMSTRSQVSKGDRLTQLQAFRKILKDEGPSGFYSGVSSAMFGIAVAQYIYYYWYEAVKKYIQDTWAKGRVLSITENMLTGAVAGSATAVLTNPIWVLNTRMVVKKDSMDDASAVPKKPLTTIQAGLKIYREEGIAGFFQGVIPALILVINPVIQFTVFERLKTAWQSFRGKALNGFDFFLLGAVSKLVATGTTYPYIVIKSRMQMKQSNDEKLKYKSLLDGVSKIIKSEGVKGLYKGIEAKLFQSVLSAAFTFAFKEELFSASVWLLTALKLRQVQQSGHGSSSQ